VTPQCRHLPLGMVLILDQQYVPDVLAAIANSRLRIQVTQVQIQHVRNIKPEAPPTTGNAGAGNPPGNNPPAGGSGPVGMNQGGGNVATTKGAAKSEEDPNLVELAIYGIAAIYERFDPNKVNASPGQGGPPPGRAGGPGGPGGAGGPAGPSKR
jgi:hypothetical protein